MPNPDYSPNRLMSGEKVRRLLYDARRLVLAFAQPLLNVWRHPLSRSQTVARLTPYVVLAHQSEPLPIVPYASPVQAGSVLYLDSLNNRENAGAQQIYFEPDYVWDVTAAARSPLSLTSSGTPLLHQQTLLDVDYGTIAALKDLPLKLRYEHYPVVIAPWSHFFGRYYTFTLWVLTKLCRIQQVITPELWQSAKFCYPRFNTAYEAQYLEKLGIPLENVVNTRPKTLKVTTDRLILANNQTRVNRISPADIQLMRRRFLPPRTGPGHRRLFFPRRYRRILKNEAELRTVVAQYGFETIEDIERSVDDQIALFQSASHIVAVHGAGLSNLVWCHPGTHVIELFYRGYTKPGFYFLCQVLGLKYDCLFDNSTATDSFSNQFCDLDIDPTLLATLLEQLP
ncbi:MAG: glycosyltransferase family 61 protein [Cyanobacteria bacterium P01_A01_bin.105]